MGNYLLHSEFRTPPRSGCVAEGRSLDGADVFAAASADIFVGIHSNDFETHIIGVMQSRDGFLAEGRS